MSQHEVERIKKIVELESFLWGDQVKDAYHGIAAEHMDAQWGGIISPILSRHPVDFSVCIDLAAGFGRNTRKLIEAGAGHVYAVDVNPDCIRALKANFAGKNATVIQNNGVDIEAIPDSTATLFYTFDSMVHFDYELVKSYVCEAYRVLRPGGYAFIHHSNYVGNPGADFRTNPHWRNFMSSVLFKHIAVRAGFEVAEQNMLDWELPALDCISVLRKP